MTEFNEYDTEERTSGPRILLIVGGIILALVVVVGVVYAAIQFVNSRTSRTTKNVAELKFNRDALETPAPVEVSKIFDKQTISALGNEGHGLPVDFSVTFRDNVEWSKHFEIEKLQITGNTDWPRRRKEVQTKIEEFEKIAAEYSAYKPRKWTIEVYVDDTEGIKPALADEIRMRVNDLGISTMLSRGDSVDFYVYRLSDAFFVNEKHVFLNPSSSPSAIENPLNWVLEDTGKKNASSTFVGFFNAASQNAGKPNRTMLVFTDWLENSQYGNFYQQRPTEDNLKKISAVRPVPDLKGAEILSYAPHDAANATQIDAAQKFAAEIFDKAGAWQVKMIY